jgi:hypothetical protein
MAIPESQPDTWSHLGSVVQSRDTYQTLRNALTNANAPYAGKSYEVFLQGSYGNDTNIYAESDVDTVIRLDAIFGYGLNALPSSQQAAFRQVFGTPAAYTFAEFKQGVSKRLSDAFRSENVSFGTKTFKIKPSGSRRSADVLPCYQYRHYTRFIGPGPGDSDYVPGAIFPTSSGEWIINYPKQHSENCTRKHQATSSWFKPMVRILKNMRSRMVDDRMIADGVAPSYYIEGLIYNVPPDQFGRNYGDTFCNCVNWLLQTDKSKLTCANEMYFLLGNSSVQWAPNNCNQFLNALVNFWQKS